MATRVVLTRDTNADGFRIINLPFPASGAEPMRLQDTPGRTACRLATVVNDSLSGLAARDGVTPVAGDRVLAKNHATGSLIGIYVAAAGAWTRAVDFDQDAEVTSGLLVFVSEGTANKDSLWALKTDNPIIVGTTALEFVQIASATGGSGVPPLDTLSEMQTIPVTNFPDSTVFWFVPCKDFFELRTSAATQDLVNLDVVTSLDPARQFHRLGYSNLQWLADASTPWEINTSTGINTNSGKSGSPLRTARELARRLRGQFYTTPDLVRVNITGNLDADDPMWVSWGHVDADQAGQTVIVPVNAIAASGSISAVTNFSSGTNTEQAITSSISLDAHVDKQLRIKTSLGAFKATAFVDVILTPGSVYALSNPTNKDNTLISVLSANVSLTAGDTFDVISFPTVPDVRVDTPNHPNGVKVLNADVTGTGGFASLGTDENVPLLLENCRLLAQTYGHKVQFTLTNSLMVCPAQPFNATWGASGGLFKPDTGSGTTVFQMRERGSTFLGFGFHPKFSGCAPQFVDTDVEVSSGAFAVFRAPLGRPTLSFASGCKGVFDLLWGNFNLDAGITFIGHMSEVRFTVEPKPVVAGGQIGMAGSVVANYTDISRTNLRDERGNHLIGPAGVIASDFMPMTNVQGTTVVPGDIARKNSVSAEIVLAQADTQANASGGLAVWATTTTNLGVGIVVLGGGGAVRTTGSIDFTKPLYLSEASIGLATTTVPPHSGTNQKRRLGWPMRTHPISGYVTANLDFDPVPTLSDGIDPSPGIVGAVSLDIDDEVQHAAFGTTEEVVAEFTSDFSLMQPALIRARLTALTKQTGGATGTYRVRVGGTQGAADGTTVATLATTQAAFPSTPDGVTGASFANPAGRALVKVTAAASAGGQEARIKGVQIAFETA